MTLIEVSVSIVILGAVLLASASAFSSTLKATGQAHRTQGAAVFLESTMENISAQAYANLLSLDGNQLFENNNAGDSNYSVDLDVWLTAVDLLQVRAVLTDLRTGRVLARVTTLRSRR